MNNDFTMQLIISILIFAPGFLLFAGMAFVGIAMAVEELYFKGKEEIVKAAETFHHHV